MEPVRGHYRNQSVELDQPLNLPEGAEVVVTVEPVDAEVREDWSGLGMSRLEEEWDNPGDAMYDDWRALYGV
jgi:hypothetical protein